mgnify:CR=1 FL=1
MIKVNPLNARNDLCLYKLVRGKVFGFENNGSCSFRWIKGRIQSERFLTLRVKL